MALSAHAISEAMINIWLKLDEFEGIKNPSKIDDICGFLVEIDDDFDYPYCMWCH